MAFAFASSPQDAGLGLHLAVLRSLLRVSAVYSRRTLPALLQSCRWHCLSCRYGTVAALAEARVAW